MRRAGLVLTLLALSAPAIAAGGQAPVPQPGRYALDAAACKANDIFLTLTADRLDLPVFSCIGLEYDQQSVRGDTAIWAVRGRKCQGEQAARPGPQRFRIEAQGTSLQILWPNGERSARMLRCGPAR